MGWAVLCLMFCLASISSTTVPYGEDFKIPLPADASDVEFRHSSDHSVSVVFRINKGTLSSTPPGYQGRVSVQGGFLVVKAVTPGDEGNYTVWDKEQNVYIVLNLCGTEYSKSTNLSLADNLTLPLHSSASVEVLFAAAGEGASVSVCAVERGAVSRPGPGYEHRVSVQSGFLTLHSLTAADQGNYTVRDSGTNRTVCVVTVRLRANNTTPSPRSSAQGGGNLDHLGLYIALLLFAVVVLCLVIHALCQRVGGRQRSKNRALDL